MFIATVTTNLRPNLPNVTSEPDFQDDAIVPVPVRLAKDIGPYFV